MKIKEVIVVEGRDDTAAVKRAVACHTIETHGFGISPQIWAQLKTAYEEKGLIIFTDPDFAGEEIRRKLTAAFPNAKQAWLTKDQAMGTKAQRTSSAKGKATGINAKDAPPQNSRATCPKPKVGIEHAAPEHIQKALTKARCILEERQRIFSQQDLVLAGLSGHAKAAEKRQRLGQRLGIGYGNSKAFLGKLNSLGITRETFFAQLKDL